MNMKRKPIHRGPVEIDSWDLQGLIIVDCRNSQARSDAGVDIGSCHAAVEDRFRDDNAAWDRDRVLRHSARWFAEIDSRAEGVGEVEREA